LRAALDPVRCAGCHAQVISTATIAAYVSLGGLGRLIIDGRAQNDYAQMTAGAFSSGCWRSLSTS